MREHIKNQPPPSSKGDRQTRPRTTVPTSRKNEVFTQYLYSTVGNQLMRYLAQTPGTIQTKPRISTPGDEYEQEADRVADQVMRVPDSSLHGNVRDDAGIPMYGWMQRRTENNNSGGRQVPYDFKQGLGPGKPMDVSLRRFFEPRFGYGFDSVRIHDDAQAHQAAASIQARAFTWGRDVVFAASQYNPGTDNGKRLIAHELAHVVQQGQGRRFFETAEEPRVSPKQAQLSGIVQRENASREALTLVARKDDYRQRVSDWYSKSLANLETNGRNAREASERFIDFSGGNVDQLATTGAVSSGIAYMFGGPGSVVALCIIVLTEVAKQKLSSKSARLAAASASHDKHLKAAREQIDNRKKMLDDRINAIHTLNPRIWAAIAGLISRSPMPQIVPENIIYRDLLFAYARGGGFNVSGSQWNVKNMSPFGDSPWYHSWDWGSPWWINGQDIAAELNSLSEGDPSTRTNVHINRL